MNSTFISFETIRFNTDKDEPKQGYYKIVTGIANEINDTNIHFNVANITTIYNTGDVFTVVHTFFNLKKSIINKLLNQ